MSGMVPWLIPTVSICIPSIFKRRYHNSPCSVGRSYSHVRERVGSKIPKDTQLKPRRNNAPELRWDVETASHQFFQFNQVEYGRKAVFPTEITNQSKAANQ